jgi:hypothetical protein
MRDKFFGNVAGVPVGSPDDDPAIVESFPSGDYAIGYVRRSLPSELALDRTINPVRDKREDGFLPQPPYEPSPFAMRMTPPTSEELQAERTRQRLREYDYLTECEADDRRRQRGMRITIGNATGNFTGPPDRVRR